MPRRFYDRDSLEVAPELLGKLLVHLDDDGVRRAGRIVEVEAYRGADDPASHAFRGLTPRTATMFGRPGGLYVYLSYGMHWCANVVCGAEGVASAVLLRAVDPVDGVDAMVASRPRARRRADLSNGPAKLCQALGIVGAHDGLDLVSSGSSITVLDDGIPPPADPGTSARVGISVAVDRPWRWFDRDNAFVSRGPRPASPVAGAA